MQFDVICGNCISGERKLEIDKIELKEYPKCGECGKKIMDDIIRWESFDWGKTTIHFFHKQCFNEVKPKID